MPEELSRRQKLILAVMSAANQGSFLPVQIQKLFFLIDKRLTDQVGGECFAFMPYDYGPFDQQVYQELDRLQSCALVSITDGSPWEVREYTLTDAGQTAGARLLNEFEQDAQASIAELTKFVRSLSFRQLVSAIYREYPEMKANSVFNE